MLPLRFKEHPTPLRPLSPRIDGGKEDNTKNQALRFVQANGRLREVLDRLHWACGKKHVCRNPPEMDSARTLEAEVAHSTPITAARGLETIGQPPRAP